MITEQMKESRKNMGELRTMIGSVTEMKTTGDIELAIKMLQNLLLKVRAGEIMCPQI